MNHPAELSIYSFLRKAVKGETNVSLDIIDQVCEDVKSALVKQFNSGSRGDFKLRMSNIGRPKCQLWFEKNDPEGKTEFPPNFLMNMILGDLVEAVFKGILRASNVEFKDNDSVTLDLGDKKITGEYDMIMDGKVDDVKSASPWSYKNKFDSFETLNSSDSFGYVPQLVGYARAANKNVGGWWVINKATGEFKYVSAENVDQEDVLQSIKTTVNYIENEEPFERCYEPIKETFNREETGNLKLGVECGFCAYKHKCWSTLQTLPETHSKAKIRKMVDYVKVA